MSKPIFIEWCPKDALDGTQMLDPWEELAYRRLLDLIYATDDQLPDDDRRLAWMTKTGNRWRKIKAALIAMGKIAVENGRITNARCQKTLEKTHAKIVQKSQAGLASAEARKTLKDKETAPTDVDPAVATTRARVNQEPKNPVVSIPLRGSATAAGDPPDAGMAPTLEARVFRRGREVLGQSAGGMITKLRRMYANDDEGVLEILGMAAKKDEPREWIGAVLRGGEERPKTMREICPPDLYRGIL